MKKLYLSLSLLFVAYLSQAQISKGTVLLGGSLSVYTDATGGSTNNVPSAPTHYHSFSVYPSAGLAVADNLVLGLQLGYGQNVQNPGNSENENDYSAGVYMRKYKYLGGKFYFFAQTALEYTYGSVKTVNVDEVTDTKTSTVNLGFSPGVAYALSRHWQLEADFPNVVNANYQYSDIKTETTGIGAGSAVQSNSTNSTFNFGTSLTTDFQLMVGVRYLIGS